MSNLDDDFAARAKRIKVRSGPITPIARPQTDDDDTDIGEIAGQILRPQLALILGAVAMVLGRAFAIHYLGVEPSSENLGIPEGLVVMVLLVAIGLIFGKSDYLSHGALVVGAALSFFLEGFYIRFFPSVMEVLYTPGYVALVTLNSA